MSSSEIKRTTEVTEDDLLAKIDPDNKPADLVASENRMKRLAVLREESQLEYLDFFKDIFKRIQEKSGFRKVVEDELRTYLTDPDKRREVNFRSLLKLYEIVGNNETEFISNVITAFATATKKLTDIGVPNESAGSNHHPSSFPSSREAESKYTPDKVKSARKILNSLDEIIDAVGESEFAEEEQHDEATPTEDRGSV